MFASFRYKLALYFLLLAVVPLASAFWAFGGVAKRAEERKVDARLQAELRAVVQSFDRQLAAAAADARRLARRPEIQRRLKAAPAHRLVIGTRSSLAARRNVRVRVGARTIGSLTAELPLDRRLMRALRADGGLLRGDRIAFAPRSRRLASSRAVWVTVSGERFRAVTTPPLAEQPKIQLAVLAPAAALEADVATVHRRLLYVLLGALAVIAGIAAVEGRSVTRFVGELATAAKEVGRGRLDRRVPVRGRDEFATLARSFNGMADQLRARVGELELERARLRRSIDRTGELLTATHDTAQLLSLITSAAVEAASAEGGVLLGEDGTVVEVGTISDDAALVELPLATAESRFGILILYGVDGDDDDLVPTRALVVQAAVALENARLHEAVEQRAITDGLTGLANRRHCEEQLAAEVARSERYASPLAVVLADIDDFKAANDKNGHAFGDLALQQFATVLRETLREIDVTGRWGGEEFLIVLPGTSLAGATDAAERIRADFAETGMTASFGVAPFSPGVTGEQLVRAADAALYEAKRSGKNRVEASADLSVLQ